MASSPNSSAPTAAHVSTPTRHRRSRSDMTATAGAMRTPDAAPLPQPGWAGKEGPSPLGSDRATPLSGRRGRRNSVELEPLAHTPVAVSQRDPERSRPSTGHSHGRRRSPRLDSDPNGSGGGASPSHRHGHSGLHGKVSPMSRADQGDSDRRHRRHRRPRRRSRDVNPLAQASPQSSDKWAWGGDGGGTNGNDPPRGRQVPRLTGARMRRSARSKSPSKSRVSKRKLLVITPSDEILFASALGRPLLCFVLRVSCVICAC